MHPFRTAIENHDEEALAALLSHDVFFISPVVFRPYRGKAITLSIVRAVGKLFEDFQYTQVMTDVTGRYQSLVFEAKVGPRHVTGCDFLHYDEFGFIDELMVMLRPLQGTMAVAAAMGAQFDQIEQDAIELARRQSAGV